MDYGSTGNRDRIHTFLRSRRSIRLFKPDPVPDSVIRRIVETATFAPSSHNLQPWCFVLIVGKPARHRLGEVLTEKMKLDMHAAAAKESDINRRVINSLRRINEAPAIVLLCRNVTAIRTEEQEEETMALQSVAAAGLQLLLAAHAEGLGGNWICWPLYAQSVVREALDLPGTWAPEGMFFLGYADEEPKEKKLKTIDEVLVLR